MKNLSFILFCIIILSSCTNEVLENSTTAEIAETKLITKDVLHRITEGEEDDWSSPSGYANPQGEIIIPIGKYKYCFSDSLKNMAIVMDQDDVCKAVDRDMNILYEVKWYDNGPDFISDGLFRIIIGGKTGYADKEGNIIIQPLYACANPFEDGKAQVTLSCELIKEGEYSRMESKEWFYIDKTGKKIDEE